MNQGPKSNLLRIRNGGFNYEQVGASPPREGYGQASSIGSLLPTFWVVEWYLKADDGFKNFDVTTRKGPRTVESVGCCSIQRNIETIHTTRWPSPRPRV